MFISYSLTIYGSINVGFEGVGCSFQDGKDAGIFEMDQAAG